MDRTPTVQLGQFVDENAEQIAERLEAAGITWWAKEPGRWTRTLFAGDWGVRLFVDAARLEEAWAIARDVTGPA